MRGFSTDDGFVEITESLGEMIKYVANEPSVGLFYVQQHAQSAIPNVINLKNSVVRNARETSLRTEDLEDSITAVRSMKECGFPTADEMVKDIRKSLALMSSRPPRRGLIHNRHNRSSSFLPGRTRSWTPTSWSHNSSFSQYETKGSGNYFSSVLKNAKEKATNFKWPQSDTTEMAISQDDKLISYPTPLQSTATASTSSSAPDNEMDELPLSRQATDESKMPGEDEQSDGEAQPDNSLFACGIYEDFKADKEAKLQEWLGETGNGTGVLQ